MTTLQPRVHEALLLYARGFNTAEISSQMGITRKTVQTYVDAAKRQLGLRTRAEVVFAVVEGQVPGGDSHALLKAEGVREFSEFLLNLPASHLGPGSAATVVRVADLARQFALEMEDSARA